VGQADEQVFLNAIWRAEGLGVLAWALGRFELPAYDRLVEADAAQQAVGFLEPDRDRDLRKVAALRPDSEIARLSSHVTVVSWRIRQFRIDPARAAASVAFQVGGPRPVPVAGSSAMQQNTGPGIGTVMDFAGYLRAHPRFQEYWLTGLRLVDGDLAIGSKSIAAADPGDVKTCASIAVERQIAAYWLQGTEPTYSKVDASTLLSSC
jgi:hypothetical protein